MATESAPNRRTFLAGTAAALLMPLAAPPAQAITAGTATALVERVATEITRIINSGRSESSMISDFERMLQQYADMPTISQSILGPPARSASAGQLRNFSGALQSYIASKYGRRFREFIGGTVTVTGAQDAGRFVEVIASVNLRGSAPFEVRFRVWDRSGSPRFIDMLIEGISLVISERNEIGSLLERRGGDIDALIRDLRALS